MKFLLYGATGYTAGLVIKHAAKFDITPVLAGRNLQKINTLANLHHLDYCTADLNNPEHLDNILKNFKVVLHCAGPFSKTAKQMQSACLRTGVHYLDITGEVEVFEHGIALNEQAIKAKIMIMSGVGFDVVPTDCMALYLKNRLPDATHLQLAFTNINGGISHGTAQTMVEGLGKDGFVRENGKLKAVPVAHKTLDVPFDNNIKTHCMAIPWGDISTAFYTTQIPNIETFTGMPKSGVVFARSGNYLGWLLRSNWVQNLLRKRLNKSLVGPDENTQANAQTRVWGKVTNAKGQSAEARIFGIEAYTLTALTALNVTKKVLEGNLKIGYQTPASAYGQDLILEVEGISREDI
ncbi:MAG: saccharopine dehydrogenase NADP-binding domain-containing protein [Arcicella sp.]|nr:saccharopine dehydrogenase NADP-binding domain-containing protein [Arcicella sp.]